jgi:hypothetical protein
MTLTRPIRLLLVGPFGALVAALVLGGMGCVSYPSPPSQPAFDTDVLPIFQAHCTRCHGDGPDGGALNAAGVPGMTYDAAGPNPPLGPFLTQFGDTCPPLADGGAGTCFNTPQSKCKCRVRLGPAAGLLYQAVHRPRLFGAHATSAGAAAERLGAEGGERLGGKPHLLEFPQPRPDDLPAVAGLLGAKARGNPRGVPIQIV